MQIIRRLSFSQVALALCLSPSNLTVGSCGRLDALDAVGEQKKGVWLIIAPAWGWSWSLENNCELVFHSGLNCAVEASTCVVFWEGSHTMSAGSLRKWLLISNWMHFAFFLWKHGFFFPTGSQLRQCPMVLCGQFEHAWGISVDWNCPCMIIFNTWENCCGKYAGRFEKPDSCSASVGTLWQRSYINIFSI